MEEIVPRSNDRLLVFAPHPDDESLGCGGLIHRAMRAGSSVNVVFVTDGDANPWPQRLAERRWLLDKDARLRWSERRAAEAQLALAALEAGTARTESLHWPDQGLTSRLLDKPMASVGRMRRILADSQPTLIAMPSFRDSHPDHSALALMLMAAYRGERCPARVLNYWLHGLPRVRDKACRGLTLTPQELNAKHAAALSHRSQGLFGTSRLLRFVASTEAFVQPPAALPLACAHWRWRFLSRGKLGALMCNTLKIVAISADGTLRSRRFDLKEAVANGEVAMSRPGIMAVDVSMAPLWPDPAWVVAKLDTGHGLNVYDSFAWSECERQVPHAVPADHVIMAEHQHEDVVAVG